MASSSEPSPASSIKTTPEASPRGAHNWAALPEDCLLRVLLSAGPNAVARAACVCKAWKAVAEQSVLWKRFCVREGLAMADELPLLSVSETWKKVYVRLLKWPQPHMSVRRHVWTPACGPPPTTPSMSTSTPTSTSSQAHVTGSDVYAARVSGHRIATLMGARTEVVPSGDDAGVSSISWWLHVWNAQADADTCDCIDMALVSPARSGALFGHFAAGLLVATEEAPNAPGELQLWDLDTRARVWGGPGQNVTLPPSNRLLAADTTHALLYKDEGLDATGRWCEHRFRVVSLPDMLGLTEKDWLPMDAYDDTAVFKCAGALVKTATTTTTTTDDIEAHFGLLRQNPTSGNLQVFHTAQQRVVLNVHSEELRRHPDFDDLTGFELLSSSVAVLTADKLLVWNKTTSQCTLRLLLHDMAPQNVRNLFGFAGCFSHADWLVATAAGDVSAPIRAHMPESETGESLDIALVRLLFNARTSKHRWLYTVPVVAVEEALSEAACAAVATPAHWHSDHRSTALDHRRITLNTHSAFVLVLDTLADLQ